MSTKANSGHAIGTSIDQGVKESPRESLTRREVLRDSSLLTVMGLGYLTFGGGEAQGQGCNRAVQAQSDPTLAVTRALASALKHRDVQIATSKSIMKEARVLGPIAHVKGCWIVAVNMADVYASRAVSPRMSSALKSQGKALASYNNFMGQRERPRLANELKPLLPAMIGFAT